MSIEVREQKPPPHAISPRPHFYRFQPREWTIQSQTIEIYDFLEALFFLITSQYNPRPADKCHYGSVGFTGFSRGSLT